MQWVGSQLVCVADKPSRDARDRQTPDHRQTMADIYAAYDRELEQSWRWNDGRKTRRLDPKGREEGTFETEEEDDDDEKKDRR
jgi:hypothetical protein